MTTKICLFDKKALKAFSTSLHCDSEVTGTHRLHLSKKERKTVQPFSLYNNPSQILNCGENANLS